MLDPLNLHLSPHESCCLECWFVGCLAQLAEDTTRVVSLTVTEKGYCQDVNGDLDTVSLIYGAIDTIERCRYCESARTLSLWGWCDRPS